MLNWLVVDLKVNLVARRQGSNLIGLSLPVMYLLKEVHEFYLVQSFKGSFALIIRFCSVYLCISYHIKSKQCIEKMHRRLNLLLLNGIRNRCMAANKKIDSDCEKCMRRWKLNLTMNRRVSYMKNPFCTLVNYVFVGLLLLRLQRSKINIENNVPWKMAR